MGCRLFLFLELSHHGSFVAKFTGTYIFLYKNMPGKVRYLHALTKSTYLAHEVDFIRQ